MSLRNKIEEYESFVRRAISQAPQRNHLDIHKDIGKTTVVRPKVALYAAPYVNWHPYSHQLIQRLITFGFDLATIRNIEDAKNFDLCINVGENLLNLPGQIEEIPNAVEILGLDYFSHIRHNSIRKTVHNFHELLATVDLMSDAKSKKATESIIADQLFGLPLHVLDVGMGYDTQYFDTDIFPIHDRETVIDIGAADGDSLAKFCQVKPKFERYVAFEPDPISFKALQSRIANGSFAGSVTAECKILSNEEKELRYHATGHGNSRIDNNGTEVIQSTTLDEYCKYFNPTLIKMDTEGSEYEIILGAEKTIWRCKPKLAISVYHHVEDLFRIPKFIKSIRSDYRFYLRCHTWATMNSSWPGSFFCETVLYAV